MGARETARKPIQRHGLKSTETDCQKKDGMATEFLNSVDLGKVCSPLVAGTMPRVLQWNSTARKYNIMYKSLLINTLFLFYSQLQYIIHTFLPATTAQRTIVVYHYFVYISSRATILYNIVHFVAGKYSIMYYSCL